MSQIPDPPLPLLLIPATAETSTTKDSRTIQVSSKYKHVVEEAIGPVYLPTLERLEVRLSRNFKVANVDPFVLRHANTLNTVCFRCVAPVAGHDRAEEDDDAIRMTLRHIFNDLGNLTCLSIMGFVSNTSNPNYYVSKIITTEIAKSLEVLRLKLLRDRRHRPHRVQES